MHLLRVWASSGTSDHVRCGIACYSWWLPPPRWLRAAWGGWYKLVIVCGHLPVICEGFLGLFSGETPKATLVNCSCHWVTSLVDRFLRCLLWWARCVIPISHRTTECWSTQRGLACRQAREPWEKNLVSIVIGILPVIFLAFILIGSSHLPRRYNHPTHSLVFTFFSFLPSVKLFSVASCESLLVWLVWLFS